MLTSIQRPTSQPYQLYHNDSSGEKREFGFVFNNASGQLP